jgi:RNA polymerase II subunit A C-terminal domain phosphatase
LKPDLPDLPSVVPPEKGVEQVESETSLETNTDLDGVTQRQEKQALDVAKQLEERPLAKAQKTVLGEEGHPPTEKKEDAIGDGNMRERSNLDELDKRIRKAVLNDDDRELDRVEAILVDAHRKFYEMHDARLKNRSNPIPDISVSSTKADCSLFTRNR